MILNAVLAHVNSQSYYTEEWRSEYVVRAHKPAPVRLVALNSLEMAEHGLPSCSCGYIERHEHRIAYYSQEEYDQANEAAGVAFMNHEYGQCDHPCNCLEDDTLFDLEDEPPF